MVITDPIRRIATPSVQRRRNVVAYNVTKSWSMVPEVMRHLPDVEFLPIEGMTGAQVAEALASATLYLELGHLPGRDRMPREAASLGTPSVVLARGAGYCWADVPLPVEDRIAFREGWPTEAARAVRRVLDDPEAARQRQEPYQAWVAEEPERYERAIDAWVTQALR